MSPRDVAVFIRADIDPYAMAARSVAFLVGDPGRAYLPRAALRQLAAYAVPVLPSLEDVGIKRSRVTYG